MSDCGHEEFIAEKHVYCPGCGETGNEMVLQKRIKELELWQAIGEAHREKYMEENQRTRDELSRLHEGSDLLRAEVVKLEDRIAELEAVAEAAVVVLWETIASPPDHARLDEALKTAGYIGDTE